MVLSDLEVVLIVAFSVILFLYFQLKHQLNKLEYHVWRMAEMISHIADGKVKAIRKSDKSIEILENNHGNS